MENAETTIEPETKPSNGDTDRPDIPVDSARLLLRDIDLAFLLGCSVRHVSTLDTRGLIPSPVHLGRCKRWSRPIIEQWAAMNCPPRDKWATLAG